MAVRDNSSRIQRAIDYVSSLAPDKNGFRGAVLLDKGTFDLQESLRISVSGVVLRGSDKEQTVLLKKGVDRGALLYMEGRNDLSVTDTLDVLTPYVPVNTCTFQVTDKVQLLPENGSGFSALPQRNGLPLSVAIFLAEVFLLWAGKQERWTWFGTDRSVRWMETN